jgi:PRTRC genetic system protein C
VARIFHYDGRAFPDPDPKLSVEDVRRHLADFFPELANADSREEKKGDDTIYAFSKRIGTKGRQQPDVVTILRRVPEKRLQLFALAAELLDDHGDVDVEAAARHQPEINLAAAEVEGYVRLTHQATDALRKLPPR